MTLNRLTIKAFIGNKIVMNTIKVKSRMIYAVAVAPDYRSDEAVLVLEAVQVAEADDDIAYLPVPVRNFYAHNACTIVEQLQGRTTAVDDGVELCRFTSREISEVGNRHPRFRRAGKKQREKNRCDEIICFHTSSIIGH